MSSKKELYERRPLSPHLSIYSIFITTFVSIFHRITGFTLYFIFSAASWLIILLMLRSYYEGEFDIPYIEIVIDNLYFRIFMSFISFFFVSHALSGIRHLVLDIGIGYRYSWAHWSGRLVTFLSVILTILLWGIFL